MADKQKQILVGIIAALVIIVAGAYAFYGSKKADTSYYNPKPSLKNPSDFPAEAWK